MNRKEFKWIEMKINRALIELILTIFGAYTGRNTNKIYTFEFIPHFVSGNDIFVSLFCDYKPTIIGFSIKTLSTLAQKQCFEEIDSKQLYEVHEAKLESYEKNMDAIWTHSLKLMPILLASELEGEKLKKLEAQQSNVPSEPSHKPDAKKRSGSTKSSFYTEANNTQISASCYERKADMYQDLMLNLKEELVDKDEYFGNGLSAEYAFFVRHLIERCAENLESLDKSANDSTRDV